jgi:hypothetical protein
MAYFKKYDEGWDLATLNRDARLDIRRNDVEVEGLRYPKNHIIDLDRGFLRRGYDRTIDLSLRLLKDQVEYNARERAIHIKLREISSLGDEILANHSSEFDKLNALTKENFLDGRRHVSRFRCGSLHAYWNGLSEGWLGDPRYLQ